MSKLSFRARALDPSKPLNIHIAEELPDLTEYSAINRAVPQMPSGMEKEEESEHHLQRAICTGLIIPTPEVFDIDQEFYDRIYPEDFKVSRQLIRMQPLSIEQDIPDYDMDSADEEWISEQTRRFDLTPLKFEEMMDCLEKSSGQTVVKPNEAKALLKQDDEISMAVYDYWLNKRLKTQQPLILTIKTENRTGTAVNNPYIAFRRRTEKMQTRKNRKNDETSYEKMLKLKRNLTRAVALLEMIKKREKTKREHVHLGIEIFEKRFQAKDFNGFLLAEYTNNAIKSSRSAFAPLYGNQYAGQQTSQYWPNSSMLYHAGNATGMQTIINKHGNSDIDGGLHNNNRKEKRQYKKRKHKNQREKQTPGSTIDHLASSDEDEPIINLNHLGHDSENDGSYPFRRSSSNQYHKPLINDYGSWPWDVRTENSAKYRFTLTSIKHPRVRCIGFARRRRGRGGRIVLDRISTNMDEFWANLDYTIYSSDTKITAKEIYQQNELRQKQQADSDNIVVDLEPNKQIPMMQNNGITMPSCDVYDNIVIKTEEKTGVTLNECSDPVNRTMNSFFDIKRNNGVNSGATIPATMTPTPSVAMMMTMDTNTNRNNASVNNINTDSNNNSGNNNNSSKNNSNNKSSYSNRLSNLHTRRLSANLTGNIRRHFNLPHSSSSLLSSPSLLLAAASSSSSPSSSALSSLPLPASSSISSALASQLQQQQASSNNDRNPQFPSLSSVVRDIDSSANAAVIQYNINNSLPGISSDNHISDNVSDLSAMLRPHDSFGDDDDVDKAISNQLYSELFSDWLHFRPKTPDDELDMCNFGEDFPQFAENSSLAVDIQRLTADNYFTAHGNKLDESQSSTPMKSVIDQNVDHTFTTTPFTYEYLVDSTKKDDLLRPSNSSDADSVHTFDEATSIDDLNLSGDSLPGALSLGDNEANDKVIDKLLEECKFDDLKSINPNTFWNGLLDENGSLLDVIDNKKVGDVGLSNFLASSNPSERKTHRRYPHQHIGSSAFNVIKSNEPNDRDVFVKAEPKPDQAYSSEANTTGEPAAAGTSSFVQQTLKKSIEKVEIDQATSSTVSALPSTSTLPIASSSASAITLAAATASIAAATSSNIIPKIQIKEETIDETIVPVTKTEIGNNVSFVSNTPIQRPITMQQTVQLQQQPHQATAYATNDQTLILSSRPIRRIQTANGPADGKSGIQHLLINRKFQMIPQRTITDDDKDVKPKIIEGAYLKLPTDFNVVQTNALAAIHSSNATSKHNYSLPPQATFHQPITLIGQSQQSQNKVIINPSHIGTTNLALATQSMSDMQNKITIPMSIPTSLSAQTSNIKLNLVPSLAQMMQSGGGIVIDAKSVQNSSGSNDQNASGSGTTTATQIHYQQQMPQQQTNQMQPQQTQHVHTQPKVKLEKTVNMMYADSERTRILYNLKNNRAGAQFLAQLNPTKVVNIVPFQQHKGGQVQGLVNKTIQRVVVSSSQSQQLANVFRQQNASASSADGGTLMSVGGSGGTGNVTTATTNNIIGSVVSGGTQGGTLIITTSSSQSDTSSLFNNDMNSTAITTTNANSINTNANNNQSLSMGNLTKVATIDKTSDLRLNHNDGNATTINR